MKEKKKERWAGASQENKVLLGWKKYSSLTKLRRVTAYVMRFANNIRAKKEARLLGALTLNELRAAQNYLVKRAQIESFSNNSVWRWARRSTRRVVLNILIHGWKMGSWLSVEGCRMLIAYLTGQDIPK